MSEKTWKKIGWALLVIGLGCLLAGRLLAYWNAPIPAMETRRTDQVVDEMKGTLAAVTARIQEQDSKTRTEVRVIHETVRTRVGALPADAVADGLNSELAVWRGVEVDADGLDGD